MSRPVPPQELDTRLHSAVARNVEDALAEDVGGGDLTAALLDPRAIANAEVVAREELVLAGRPWVDEVYRRLDERIEVDWNFNDGDRVGTGSVIFRALGPAPAILSGERTALNFLQLLSGTATATARYAAAIEGTKARILDTRKTLPGLRVAQKYAVRCGGGTNHRMGLYDAILLKENHLAMQGGVGPAVAQALRSAPEGKVEVEVENASQLAEALGAGVRRILLDNFSIAELREAVALNRKLGNPPAQLEASGGVTIRTLRDIAETGVDWISVGALTKHVQAADLSMRCELER